MQGNAALLFSLWAVWFGLIFSEQNKKIKKKRVEDNMLTTGELNLYFYYWEPKSGEK